MWVSFFTGFMNMSFKYVVSLSVGTLYCSFSFFWVTLYGVMLWSFSVARFHLRWVFRRKMGLKSFYSFPLFLFSGVQDVAGPHWDFLVVLTTSPQLPRTLLWLSQVCSFGFYPQELLLYVGLCPGRELGWPGWEWTPCTHPQVEFAKPVPFSPLFSDWTLCFLVRVSRLLLVPSPSAVPSASFQTNNDPPKFYGCYWSLSDILRVMEISY